MQKGKHNPCEPHTRVHLLPVQPHHRLLALYALSDVVLDSLPTSGCTTTREALPPSSTDRRDPRQGCPRLRVCSVREAVPTHAAVPLSVHPQPNSHTLLPTSTLHLGHKRPIIPWRRRLIRCPTRPRQRTKSSILLLHTRSQSRVHPLGSLSLPFQSSTLPKPGGGAAQAAAALHPVHVLTRHERASILPARRIHSLLVPL